MSLGLFITGILTPIQLPDLHQGIVDFGFVKDVAQSQ